MTRKEAWQGLEGYALFIADGTELKEAISMAIEALKREAHDGCDGCRYEENDELTPPCASCKQNYMDRYMPEPKHDRDWIVGCIEHDGFIKTDRGDKANQIILEALEADKVEVVRCKDCKHRYYADNRVPHERTWVCERFSNEETTDSDFCSFGERSE